MGINFRAAASANQGFHFKLEHHPEGHGADDVQV
jgi:hypothetical protein